MHEAELIELEHAGWRALSTDGDAAAAFFDRILATDVVMLLPGGLLIDDRQQVIESMRGAPWSSYDITDERVVPLTRDAATVAYRASARRGDSEYQALFNSTYVREGADWKMVLHQQTPI